MRLERDAKEMEQLRKDSTILEYTAEGDPPDKYRIIFHGGSPVVKGNRVVRGDRQEIDVRLGSEYPRTRPDVHWRTPIVHPNISGSNVCFGNFGTYWSPNMRLVEFVEVLWDYARLAVMNPYHSYEGANAPAKYQKILEQFGGLPDERPLRDKVKRPDEGSSIVRPDPADKDDILIIDDDGGTCG